MLLSKNASIEKLECYVILCNSCTHDARRVRLVLVQVAAVKEAPPGATRQQPLPAAPAVQTPGGGQDALFAAFADQGGEEEFLAGGDDESAWERYDF